MLKSPHFQIMNYVCAVKDYREIVHLYHEKLSPIYPVGEIDQLFLMAYAHLTGKPSVRFHFDKMLQPDKGLMDRFLQIMDELATARPIQHILGVADFYGMRLTVNDQVLIPRPETEELVDRIVKKHAGQKDLTVLDVGTGSGCIAIALKKHLPQARVFAMDISGEAIETARKNAAVQRVEIDFIQTDVLKWDLFVPPGQRFDLIVSNPPYITPRERAFMHQNVLQFEPSAALFVEQDAPLLFYDRISEMGRKHLQQNGLLYFEINPYLAGETAGLLGEKGYRSVRIFQDINGSDRMLCAEWQGE